MKKFTTEICAGSLASAIAAQEGGADRIELCSSLNAGGITPSPGMLLAVKKILQIPVFVLVRPREGDFLYSPEEFDAMREDIRWMKKNGAGGFVFGLLDENGGVDIARNRELVRLASPLPCTFHRAIDVCRDPLQALENIIACGFTRVLSSGAAANAAAGAEILAMLVLKSAGRISIMPGGGINEQNIRELIRMTGANEFHASLKTARSSAMRYRHENVSMGGTDKSEYEWDETSAARVRTFVQAVKSSA